MMTEEKQIFNIFFPEIKTDENLSGTYRRSDGSDQFRQL